MKREFFIAGVQFRPKDEIRKAMKEIKVGELLMLEPEPSNKYDPNAVKIIFLQDITGYFIGYVPKKFSAEVAGLLEAGIELECVVKSIDPSAKPWEMCKVVVRDIVEDEEVEDEEDDIDD